MRCELAQYETGGAWLSSARVVRCWVKSRNERNPYRPLLTRKGEDSDETAGDNSEEGGDDVKSSCPLRPGLHTCYNGYNKEKRDRKVEQNSEKYSQFRLWAATRPHEVGIASNRGSACRGEYAVSYTHLDVYKRQVYCITVKALDTNGKYSSIAVISVPSA